MPESGTLPCSRLQTGIAVRGNDHYVSNSIVFSALVGVELTGAANILQVRRSVVFSASLAAKPVMPHGRAFTPGTARLATVRACV